MLINNKNHKYKFILKVICLDFIKILDFFVKIYKSLKMKTQHISDIIRINNVDRKNILFIGNSFIDYKATKIKKNNFLCKSNS